MIRVVFGFILFIAGAATLVNGLFTFNLTAMIYGFILVGIGGSIMQLVDDN